MGVPSATPEILEAEVPATGILQVVGTGEVDVQIATAKRYPRSIAVFKKVAMDMATLDEETAEACFYALPRDGKTVEGPSARLAEICASAWGNMRIEARMVGEDDRFVTSRGTAWDLQANVAIAYEVKRRITTSAKFGKEAKKYTDDMIGVTSNAASSIALRNAVFKVIPAAYWKPIYHACRKAAVGDIKTLANRRAAMLEHFQKMGVTGDQVFALLGVKGPEDITLDHLATLKGLATALKDGETTIEEAFGQITSPPKPGQRVSEQQKAETPVPAAASAKVDQGPQQGQGEARTREMPSAAAGTVGGPSTPPETPPSPIGIIVKTEIVGSAVKVTLDTGFKCSTRDPELQKSVGNLVDTDRRVELITRPSSDPSKYAPVLTGIEFPVDEEPAS